MDDRFDFATVLKPYFTIEQVRRIQSTVVGIAGAGGLGSNCAMNLIRSGFVQLIIADFDRIEATNLNRQAYFSDQIGKVKVEALKENLLRVNPAASVTVLAERLTVGTAEKVFTSCDIVIEAFDTPDDKMMLAEIYADSGKLFICASGLAGIGSSDRIRTKKVHDLFYVVGDMKTGIGPTVKPYAPCVSIAAAKQADIALEWVVNTLNNKE